MYSLPTSGIRAIYEKAKGMRDVIRLEIGEPNLDTPNHIKKAARKAIDAGFTHYTSSSGSLDLRELVAEKVGTENGISADLANVVVTPGASSAVYCAIVSIVNAGEEVLIPDPGWPNYEACVKIAGGVPVHYPQFEKDNFRVNPANLEKMINERTKAILINSPNNPTGSVLEAKHLQCISRLAQDKDLIVISDEVYEKIIYDNVKHTSIASLPDMLERTVTVNALSKAYAMTGWRIGYAIAPADVAEQMAKLVLYTGTCANSIGQKAAMAALGGSQDSVQKAVHEYRRRRDIMIRRLNEIQGISCTIPKGAFYAFPNIKNLSMNAIESADFFLTNASVSTVPGTAFGKNGEGYLRLSYATSVRNLIEGLDRIEKCLKLQNC